MLRKLKDKCHKKYRKNVLGVYSNFSDQEIIIKYINDLNIQKFCVDIAASDGQTMSNTYALFKDGWISLVVEYDTSKFAKLSRKFRKFHDVNLAKTKVTPFNVISLLKGYEVPEKFGFFNLDIDSYDYYILEQILSCFRPSLICAEINEKIPPPIKFTVKYSPKHVWAEDHFHGQSISQLHFLCDKFNYCLVKLHYNNAFIIPEELNIYSTLTPQEAYTQGYLNQPDRQDKFPWNKNMEEIHSLSPKEAVNFLNTFFKRYEGKYICSL